MKDWERGVPEGGLAVEAQPPRLLLVDDDEPIRRVLTRLLTPAYQVTPLPSAEEAIAEVRARPYDAVLSDVFLKGMTGVEFLRRLREQDLDLPVLLMSGEPNLDAAMRAVEYGAMRFLRKPVDPTELRAALAKAVSMRRLAEARRRSVDLLGLPGQSVGDRAGLDAVVDGALRSLKVAWQPIVSWQRRRTVGYEALMRSRLPDPAALLEAAAKAGRTIELGRAMRDAVAVAGELAPMADLYVNLHPQELLDEALFDPTAPLSRLARRVVLEVTERSSLESLPDARERMGRLRKLGFRLALDDVGSGYAGLASFVLVEPEVVKLDLSLVRDVHRSTTRRRLIASLLAACRDLGSVCVAEGVELPAERDALAEIGCDLFQGFLFGRPGFAFPEPQF